MASSLDGIEAWMTVNKESIFNTRPWVRFGEGPVAESDIKLKAQGFNDGMYSNMTSADIRFNQTKKYLYVTPLGWPEDGKVVVRSLKKNITTVELLGYGCLKVVQTDNGLEIQLPIVTNAIAPVLKISK